MSADNKMADMILDDRRLGLSYRAIGQKHGISAEDARTIAREILESTSEEDEWELRAITLLRLESVVNSMWTNVENGSFKHAEVLIKTLDQIANLLALNKQVMVEQKSAITDEQAAIVYRVMTESNKEIKKFILDTLKPNKKQLELLEEWPSVASEAATNAIEATLLAEEEH